MLSSRSTLPELMDAPGLPAKDIQQALRELETIGKRLGGYRVAIDAIRQIAAKHSLVRIMDLGSGGGDTLRAVARWAKKADYSLELTGIDINPEMTVFAQEQSAGLSNIAFMTADVFDDRLLAEHPDVIISSLFCHHFNADELVVLISKMYAICSVAVVINDLHRHPVAYYSIKILTQLFSKSYMVKYDAPLSVARGFTRSELEQALDAAGISNYTIRWCWAWRWQVIILKQEKGETDGK